MRARDRDQTSVDQTSPVLDGCERSFGIGIDSAMAAHLAAYAAEAPAIEAERRRTREECAAKTAFRPVSLGDWMDLCAKAQVPTVAAICLGEVAIEPVLRFDEPEGAAARPFYEEARRIVTELGPGYMVRWDCCSMASIKYELSSGRAEWLPEFADLYADDIRAFDILFDFPGTHVRAWARPWTAFAALDGYPIEYRVFVDEGRVVGVSNYYPQRPLPAAPDIMGDIARATAWTERLIAAQDLPVLCPAIDDAPGCFTADFARLPSGALIFLEGGPPHTPRWGAHPCCFTGGEVSGIALSADGAPRHATDEAKPNGLPSPEAGVFREEGERG